MNKPNIKPALHSKNKEDKSSKYKDPPRYPNIIEGYEMKAKKDYFKTIQKIVSDIVEVLLKK